MTPISVAERPAGAPPSSQPHAPQAPFAQLSPPPQAFHRRHPVLIYFILVFVLAWGALLPVLGGPLSTSGNDRKANPLFLLAIMAGPLAPAAASLLLTGLLDGRAGYRELLGRLGRWRVGWRWYAAALLAGPLPILLATTVLVVLLRSPNSSRASSPRPQRSAWCC